MPIICQKCGRRFKPGELRYQLSIELTSMFDGYVEEPREDVDEQLDRLVEAVSRQDAEDVMKDIVQNIQLVICRNCRNQIVNDYDKKDNRTIH